MLRRKNTQIQSDSCCKKKAFSMSSRFYSIYLFNLFVFFGWFDFFSLLHRVSCCFTLFDVASLQQFSFFLQSNATSSFVLSKVKCSASAVHQIFDGCGQLRTGNFGKKMSQVHWLLPISLGKFQSLSLLAFFCITKKIKVG